jgi:hypothetical protein
MFYVRYLLAELRRRPGRTALTALGLAVGVGLVVVVGVTTTLGVGLMLGVDVPEPPGVP